MEKLLKPLEYDIAFEPAHGKLIYYPGDTFSGTVNFIFNKPKVIESYESQITGVARCEWTDMGKPIKEEKIYEGITKKVHLVPNRGIEINGQPAEGEYKLSYSVKIPKDLPASFSDEYGGIFYDITASLKVKSEPEFKKTLHFTIRNIENYDLGNLTKLKDPYHIEEYKRWNYLWWMEQEHRVTIDMPKRTFINGENMTVGLEIMNPEKLNPSCVETSLIRKTHWSIKKKHKYKISSVTISSDKKEANGAASQLKYSSFTLPIPKDYKYPHIPNCDLIWSKHLIMIKIHTPKEPIILNVPVTINDLLVTPDLEAAPRKKKSGKD